MELGGGNHEMTRSHTADAPEVGKPPPGGTLLCVANFPSDTGYAWWLMERFWASLAREADERGGRAMMAFPKIRDVSKTLRSAPLSLEEMDIATGLGGLKTETLRFIRRNRVRTLYLTDRPYWSPAYALFRACGVKSIILHDHIPGERPLPPPLKMIMKKARHVMTPAGADLYVGVSKFVCERFTRIAGVPSKACTYVHNGVPLRPTSDCRDVRDQFALPDGAQVVVSLGRAHPYKGIEFIIGCATELIHGDGREDLFFLHLGDGPDLERLRGIVRQRRLAGRFLLPGRRDDIQQLLPSCQVAVHASHGEAFSLAILEFLAAGLPAIVPDHCGNPEAVLHGETGFLYAPGNHGAAVSHLRELLDHPERAVGLGEAARHRATSEFSLEKMDRRFLTAVRGAIQL